MECAVVELVPIHVAYLSASEDKKVEESKEEDEKSQPNSPNTSIISCVKLVQYIFGEDVNCKLRSKAYSTNPSNWRVDEEVGLLMATSGVMILGCD